MASAFLSCTICPKRPNFSDTSHLLTHVSSKGHLSHLHKLQVRSHQEIAAGHQLALYNEWYQQHDLGNLLSERLLQKEAKTSNRRPARFKPESNLDPSLTGLVSNQIPVASLNRLRPKISRLAKRQETPEDNDSDYNSSPVRKKRRSARKSLLSPVKRFSSDDDVHTQDADCLDEDEAPSHVTTPDTSKLKGIIWPGMDLFDAATAEMKRKRNQKKDGSILKQMEKTSAIVEPTEVIYSSGGTRLKERLIDGNIDDSSPLRGETPVPRPVTRKRRKPLASINANVPRASRRGVKAEQSAKIDQLTSVCRQAPFAHQRMSYLPSSSIHGSRTTSLSRFSPTEDEAMEFKLTVGNLSAKRRPNPFTVFDDNANHVALNMPKSGGIDQDLFGAGPNKLFPARPQLSIISPPWLQPHNQQLQLANYSPAYMSYHSQHTYVQPQQSYNFVKTENDQYLPTINGHIGTQRQPLEMDSLVYKQIPFQQAISDSYIPFFGGLNPNDDVFGFSKNPLSAALDQLHRLPSHQHENEKIDSSKGKVPEHEDEYERALFATSE